VPRPFLPLAPILLLLALMAGCSSLSIGYGQAPRLLAWWVDDYLDLDRAQQAQADAALQQLHAWHRREELPHWQALLRQAQRDAQGGLDAAELRRLEERLDASLRRSLRQAAPLAQALLAGLAERQWQGLQRQLDEKLDEWREREADDPDGRQRARRYVRGLSNWLGDLTPAAEQEAHAQALGWPRSDAALWRERAARRALIVDGLRAWSRGEHEAGVELLMAASARVPQRLGPAEQAQRQRKLDSLSQVLALQPPAEPRRRWAKWLSDLESLQGES